jgi:hypothetical protein
MHVPLQRRPSLPLLWKGLVSVFVAGSAVGAGMPGWPIAGAAAMAAPATAAPSIISRRLVTSAIADRRWACTTGVEIRAIPQPTKIHQVHQKITPCRDSGRALYLPGQ